MTLRRVEILQWVGFVLGGAVWFAGHIVAWGVSEATCDSAGFDVNHDLWQVVVTTVSAALVLAAAAASVVVLRETRSVSYEAAAPTGRMRFLALASLAANTIFLVIIVLDAIGAIFSIACRQA